jgi:hypothetical protein
MCAVLRCFISGSTRKWTMYGHDGPLNHSTQSAALRRKADRLHILRGTIDRYASVDNGERYALLSIQISELHETARRLLA